MTVSLEQRVRDFVCQHPGLTSTEIARGVRARSLDVLDVLASEAFSASPREAYASDRAQVYRVVAVAGEKRGRAARRSQCSLVAAVLADGAWHTTSEIHFRCGFSRLNSRVAELRRVKGMVIENKRLEGVENGPDAYAYRLVGFKAGFGTSEAADALSGDAAAPGGESAASDAPDGQHLSPVVADVLTDAGASDVQLGLGEAA